jgi:glycosyltransferase involved in cell wall biosynthesis
VTELSLIILSGDLQKIGGLQVYVKKFVDFAKDSGVKVEVLHRPGLFPVRYPSEGKPLRGIAVVERSADLNPCLRYVLTLFTFVLFGILYAFKIVRSSRVNIIHSQDTGYAGIVGLLLSKLTRKPLVLHVHGKLWARSSSSSYSYYERTIGSLIAKNSARIILVSHNLLLYYSGIGIPKNKMCVINTGVNLASYSNETTLDTSGYVHSPQELRIGYIGRLDSIKNVDGLIRGFANATKSAPKRLSLIIVGDGPDRMRLEDLARSLNTAIHFKGFVNDVFKELSTLDVFVLPSFSEGCPLSLLEAMASSKAIIASNLPSISEIVRHEKEAVLVNPYDIDELSQAILLLSRNPDLRAKLGCNAFERAKMYNSHKGYKQILNTYKACTFDRGKRT